MSTTGLDIREATIEDQSAINELCETIWPDRGPDYLPRIYSTWIQGTHKKTLVAEKNGECHGIAQCVLLTETEAWCQGLRVHPDARGEGIAQRLLAALFSWARQSGATVARSMVFSWNGPGMGIAQAAGFDPVTSFRWAYPPVTADRSVPVFDGFGDIAWEVWSESEARSWLSGLALSTQETWALEYYTPERIRQLGTEDRTYAVVDGNERAATVRGQQYEEASEDTEEIGQEYLFATWSDPSMIADLFAVIGADAATQGADQARVLLPELPTCVAAVAKEKIPIDESPHYIFCTEL